jgi:hypothetical protein
MIHRSSKLISTRDNHHGELSGLFRSLPTPPIDITPLPSTRDIFALPFPCISIKYSAAMKTSTLVAVSTGTVLTGFLGMAPSELD